jgi:hypothetical protein
VADFWYRFFRGKDRKIGNWPIPISGVDVMITIFCKKIGVVFKNQCYDQFFSKISSSWSKKRQFFAKFFGEKFLKIITSVPAIGAHFYKGDLIQTFYNFELIFCYYFCENTYKIW